MKFIRKLMAISIALFLVMDILFPKGSFCITIKEEEELSREFVKIILKRYEVIKDPLIAGYINKVGNRVLSAAPPQPFTYQFYIIKEDVYNAFAGPGGIICINSGLFEAMENEGELAGILGHEIAHVVCRHISQRIERSSKMGLATLAGFLAGVFLGAGGAGAAAGVLTIGSLAVSQSVALAYSRENEVQADQIGLTYLTKAGYSGIGLLTMLKKIRSKDWFTSEQIPTYLMTHPGSGERIAYLDTLLEGKSKKAGRASDYRYTTGLNEFERIHTRFVTLYGEKNLVLKKCEADIKKNPSDPMTQYRYGLILARTGNRKDAVVHIKRALEKKAFDPYTLIDLGRIYFQDGQYPEALTTLESAISLAPDDPEGLFFLGRTQMELGNLDKAASVFKVIVEKHPEYTQALYFLGDVYGKHENFGEAHYYLGIYYKKEGDLKNASFHLKRALEKLKDSDKKDMARQMLKEINRVQRRTGFG